MDVVGQGLSWAFGTATAAQIEDVQKQLDRAHGQQSAVVHNVERLITLVNQTSLEQRQTRKQLAILEHAHDAFIRNEQSRWETYDNRKKLLLMEQMVRSLINIDEGLHRELGAIEHLHDVLRSGLLTEIICPPELINGIAKKAEGYALRALPLEWYYENIKVKPLLLTDGQMTYQITLPFVKQAVYKRYRINAYPVPMNDSGIEIAIKVEHDVAIHTTEGYWFVPRMCTGRKPRTMPNRDSIQRRVRMRKRPNNRTCPRPRKLQSTTRCTALQCV